MTAYERIFGTGPRGLLISSLLLGLVGILEKYFNYLQITESYFIRYVVFTILTTITVLIIGWSVKSLPPSDRGNKLIIVGAFKYFRHPLYGASLTFFNFGLAFLLNNWIYIFWAIIQHPVWHLNIKGEEKLMEKAFPNDYEDYCKKTGRFFPRLFR